MQINSEKLIMLRKRAGLTAVALAEVAQIGRATITRIENGRTAKSNAHTMSRLCKVLRCSPQDLTTPPERDDQSKLLSNRQSTPYEMSSACQNALALIAHRYGEKPETILELAPLLFDIIARESLIERRQALDEITSHREAIKAMADRFPQFSGRFTNDWEADEFEYQEELSIGRNDLRGELVHADRSMSDSFYPVDFDEECDNPFVVHLRRRCEQLGQRGFEAARVDSVSRWFGPTYHLGMPEAIELAGGDNELAEAVIHGRVPLASMPKELAKIERLRDRQEWMQHRIAEGAERARALWAELGFNDLPEE